MGKKIKRYVNYVRKALTVVLAQERERVPMCERRADSTSVVAVGTNLDNRNLKMNF